MIERRLGEILLQVVPTGVIVLDVELRLVYCNVESRRFLGRYELPDEVVRVAGRLFATSRAGRMHELFPGEVYIEKRLGGSTSKWSFKLHLIEDPPERIAVFITEGAVSNRLDMKQIRIQYRLTRRETDVLRRALRGLKNSQIAEDLNITVQTVKDHLRNIYGKIGIANRKDLMRIFVNQR